MKLKMIIILIVIKIMIIILIIKIMIIIIMIIIKVIVIILIIIIMVGMADECLRYHSRLAELLSAKKQDSYATTSWVRAKVSFAILRSALLCLRGSRTPRRRNLDVKDRDLEIEKGQTGLP